MAETEDEAKAEEIARRLHRLEGTARAWNLRFDGAGIGWAKCSMVVREDMLNGHGVCHGGLIFALADTAFAWACNSRNVKTLAQQASISFLSPARLGERLAAEAREEAAEGRSGVYTATVRGEDGRTIAVFQGLSRTAGGAIVVD
jgi:acyl-CoA thioesterase